MSKIGTRVTAAVVVAVGALTLTACSTVATSASEVALEYGGGAFDSPSFVKCFNAGYKSTTEGASDTYRYYPIGQRDFSFGGDKGLDSAALSSMTKDSQQVEVPGTIKFTMNLSCKSFKDPTGREWPGGTAQYFHEIIGSKDFGGKFVYNEEGSQGTPGGWSAFLREYMGFAVNDVLDDQTLTFTQAELNADADAKTRWQANVKKALPRTLRQITNGVEIFRVTEVLLQRPGISPKIADALDEQRAAQIVADSSKIDSQAAATWPGGIQAYLEYKRQQALNEAIKDGKVKVVPMPYGSSVIIDGGN